MGPIGVPELIIIFIVALLVFGPRKLPELGKSLGRGLSEFRRASNELRNTLEEEVRSIDHEPPPPPSKQVEVEPADPESTPERDGESLDKTAAEPNASADPSKTQASEESEPSSASSPDLTSESKAEPKLDVH